jgi:hypothetical protein
MDMDREGFFAWMTNIGLLRHKRKPRLCLVHFRCSYLSLKWKLMPVHCSFKSDIRKSQAALHMHKDKHLLRHDVEVCGCKIHRTNTQESNSTQAVIMESCTAWHSQSVRSGNLGHIFIFCLWQPKTYEVYIYIKVSPVQGKNKLVSKICIHAKELGENRLCTPNKDVEDSSTMVPIYQTYMVSTPKISHLNF